MDLIVSPDATGTSGFLSFDAGKVRCALGRGGVVAATDKREGDGATPAGEWPLRRGHYRPDRQQKPPSALAFSPLSETDGWCDWPSDPRYNQPVALPYDARCEAMWREDHLYDLMVVLGHNDDPPVPGLGSAIFFHLAHDDYRPTEGCIAVAAPDMLTILSQCSPESRLIVLGSAELG
ncbi:MAG: L,D-transpeptidase family protein [Pseudomonadota bacterium]